MSTHTPTNRDEVIRVRDFVKLALCELLEIHEAQFHSIIDFDLA